MFKKKISNISVLFTMIIAFVVGIHASSAQGANVKVLGYAWSDNIGWISMNCEDGGAAQANICGGANYGVTIDAANNFQGFGWSENVGWIKFGGLSGIPNASINATYDPISGKISGFARFCGGMYGSGSWPNNQWLPNNTCSGSNRQDGWDGWLSLSGKSPSYGVTISANGTFSGYAWGSDVVGWTDFSAVKLSTAGGPESINLDIGQVVKPYVPPGVFTYIPAMYTSTPTALDPATITIATGDPVKFTYSTVGASSCAISGTGGLPNYTIPAAGMPNGSSGTAYFPTGTRDFLTLTCTMNSGAVLTKIGIVDIATETLTLITDPNYPLNSTDVKFTYWSTGVKSNSCQLTSHKPNNAYIAPGPGSNLPDPIPGWQQVSDWNNTTPTPVSYTAGQALGSRIVLRQNTSTRYFIRCISSTSGNWIYRYIDAGTLEISPMLLTANPATVAVGGKTTLTWDKATALSPALSSCTASAFKGGTSTAISVSGWTNGAILPPSTKTPPAQEDPLFSLPAVSVPGADGDSVKYQIQCQTAWGALAMGETIVDIRGTGPDLQLSASPSSFTENTSGLTTTLSWTHSNPALFPTKACRAGDGTAGSTGMKVNGTWKNANNWTGLTALTSPNASKANVEVYSLPVGTPVEYSITCRDTLGIDHVAKTNIVYTPDNPDIPAVNIEFLGCLPDNVAPVSVSIGWASANVDKCYIPASSPIQWHPLMQLWINAGQFGNTLGGQFDGFPYGGLPFTFRIECEAPDGTKVQDAVTVDQSCTATDAGPKKPRFEEF